VAGRAIDPDAEDEPLAAIRLDHEQAVRVAGEESNGRNLEVVLLESCEGESAKTPRPASFGQSVEWLHETTILVFPMDLALLMV